MNFDTTPRKAGSLNAGLDRPVGKYLMGDVEGKPDH